VTQNQGRGLIAGGLQNERNIMKQIIIRMFVALTMCGVTSLIRFTSFVVISTTPPAHTEIVWILRIILASVLSPLLYGFLDRRTSTWGHPVKTSTPVVEEFLRSHK
jgi:hypothetical protein